MKEVCGTCGRRVADAADWASYGEGEGEHLCWNDPFACNSEVKIAALEAERDRYRDALTEISRMPVASQCNTLALRALDPRLPVASGPRPVALWVCDGCGARADWSGHRKLCGGCGSRERHEAWFIAVAGPRP